MNIENIRLVSPTADLKNEFLEMVEEYRRTGAQTTYTLGQDLGQILPDDRPDQAAANFEPYRQRLEDQSKGIGLPEGYTPMTTFWPAHPDRRILGVSRLRHRLEPPGLIQEGGNIGYDIRLSERGKGYGTIQLALVLEKAAALGLKRVLLTCDPDNTASARVIQKNGGVLENEIISKLTGGRVARYWIEL